MRIATITLPSGSVYTVRPVGARYALYAGDERVSQRKAESLEDAVNAWLGARTDTPSVQYAEV